MLCYIKYLFSLQKSQNEAAIIHFIILLILIYLLLVLILVYIGLSSCRGSNLPVPSHFHQLLLPRDSISPGCPESAPRPPPQRDIWEACQLDARPTSTGSNQREEQRFYSELLTLTLRVSPAILQRKLTESPPLWSPVSPPSVPSALTVCKTNLPITSLQITPSSPIWELKSLNGTRKTPSNVGHFKLALGPFSWPDSTGNNHPLAKVSQTE